MLESYTIGKEVEAKALQWFLENRKCRLLIKNFRCRAGEIDFIVEEKLPTQIQTYELVFVEVRARAPGKSWFDPISSIGWKKKICLRKAAEVYLGKYKGRATSARFDLLCWDTAQWEHRLNIQVGQD